MNLIQLDAVVLALPPDLLGPIVVWMVIIAFVVATALALFPISFGDEHERALDFLRKRLEDGDISEAEYNQARRILG